MIKNIMKIMDAISKYCLRIIFTVCFILAFFIKAMYSFEDKPYFEFPTVYDLGMGIGAVCLFAVIYIKREYIQNKINYVFGFLLFIVLAGCFIYLVPLKPFSDMEHVYGAAVKFAEFDWNGILEDEYWNIFPGNIGLGVFWGILVVALPKYLVTFKIINALFLFGIILFTSKICKLYGMKYYKVLYLYMILFSPLILYINHVYFDLPYLFFCILALYIDKRYQNIVLACFILTGAVFLRQSAVIFLIALILCRIFELFGKKGGKGSATEKIKQIGIMALCVVLCLVASKGMSSVIKTNFLRESQVPYPSWNQIYIGLNEEKLGMMDGDFSYERSAADVGERIKDYGVVKTTKILAKKTFWLWTQGTYQAERYGFGENREKEEDKFEYKTIVTNHLLNEEQPLRKMANAFMRFQYIIFFGLMVYTLWRRKDISDVRMWYYIMMATFLVMIFYELKSRYIIHCLFGMFILACWALEDIAKKLEQIREQKKA